jgi:hypothetical protein
MLLGWTLRDFISHDAPPRVQAAGPRDMRLLAGLIYGHSVGRLAWCSIQWRAWLSEARRTRRAIVVSRLCVDRFKRCDEGRKYCDYHRNSQKCDGGTVAIPPVKHEGTSTLTWKRYAACMVPRAQTGLIHVDATSGQAVTASLNRMTNLHRFVPDFEHRVVASTKV